MAARDIIIRPIVTEKTMKAQETDNKVTFEVAKGANKTAVKLAVEEIFNVKVEKVNIVNTPNKTKRLGRYVGEVGGIRKAIVKLAEGSTINLYEEGYVAGIKPMPTKEGLVIGDIQEAIITMKGVEYLLDNSLMQKVKRTLKDVKEMIPFT